MKLVKNIMKTLLILGVINLIIPHTIPQLMWQLGISIGRLVMVSVTSGN